MSERASKYRTQRRKELLAALDNCEELIETVEKTFATEYRKAFALLIRAGERYDKARRLSDLEWDQVSLNGMEPDQLSDQVDTAFADAKETVRGVRDEIEKGSSR